MVAVGAGVLACLAAQRLTLSLVPHLGPLDMGHQDMGCVDMPIGLTSHGQTRCCDRLVRRLLAPARRSSSVFSPPGRCCLTLSDHDLATAAQRSGGGPGLSIQSWHLLGRIQELECWLQAQPQRPRQLLECHPELTFFATAATVSTGAAATRQQTPPSRSTAAAPIASSALGLGSHTIAG